MVGSPLIANPGEYDYDILHMPGYRQAQDAPECIHYALWIATNYVANEYPKKEIRHKSQPPKLDLISEYIDIGRLGWEDPGQEPLTGLASETGTIKLNLQYKYNGLPQRVDEFVQEGLDQLLPTIIWVDQVLLKNNERGEGPMHAVVVCGVGDEHITIEDPLVEGTTTLEIDRLNDAWDPEYNTAIEMRLRNGLEPTRREEI